MDSTAGGAGSGSPVARLGFRPDMVVQELGWDDDVDDGLRLAIEELLGAEMVDGDVGDVVDGVLLWWRDDDGDLVDALVDSLTDLGEAGTIWLLTPKVGRNGYVDPADIAEAAPVAGLATTSTQTASADWSATKLVTPKSARRPH
ncbi:MAG: hypothetical protein K0Q93_1698 [Nocardioidaceae bacterium]|nr:hypothetical protein [Nocardioidaceae bacterium]